MNRIVAFLFLIIFNIFCNAQKESKYIKIGSIPVPKGFLRTTGDKNSFEEYLRNLPLKTENNNVYLFDGRLKGNQSAQFAVVKMDVGTQDLQQCADAVMRLRGEYLFSQKKYSEIHFTFVSDGKPRYFKDYKPGDVSYKNFRKYMNFVFSYANTASLKKELKIVGENEKIKPGDVFIMSGKPYGHAVTVVDAAENEAGDQIFMIAQSYMPAQEIHVLVNENDASVSPWYFFKQGNRLETPEWTFDWSDLRKF